MASALQEATTEIRRLSETKRPLHLSDAEWAARVDTAACNRLMALYRMTDLANGFVGTRLADAEGHFLLAPYGMFNEEITASSLHKLSVHDWPDARRGADLNAAAVSMIQAVFKARPDVGCVIHAHTKATMALASLDTELLPISQAAVFFKRLWGFSDFEFECGDAFCRQLIDDLDGRAVLLMRHHGLFVAGRSVPEAFFMAFYLNQACEIQLDCMMSGAEILVPEDARSDAWREGYHDNPWWEYDGSREWPALMRKLRRDMPGFDA